jgi:thymidylate synthase (FAD)
MNVKLVSLTQSLITEKQLSPEELIVYIARVSNPSNQLNSETSDRLISYMVRNKHWSPFEMVDMTVEIVTSRAIAQQILRHRSFSFQEFSQRYAEVIDMEPVQLRSQADKNRQSSTEDTNPMVWSGVTAEQAIRAHIRDSQKLYKVLLETGVAKECARMVLPLTTQTKIYMKGSVRSWIHYLQIRCDAHTQLEHQQIAKEILGIFRENFPMISKGLEL